MLWTAVWSVYLEVVRSVDMPLRYGLGLTIYLAALLALRLKWGYERIGREYRRGSLLSWLILGINEDAAR